MQRSDPMTELFHFAFVNFLLRTLPPGLMTEVDQLTKDSGFAAVLCAIAQSRDAQRAFRRMMQSAVEEARSRGHQLGDTRLLILSHLKPGAKIEPR